MGRWTLEDNLAFLLLLSLLLPSLLIMFIPSTFKRPVSSWKALNLRKTLLMASSVRLKPLNCSRLPCVYAQETLTLAKGLGAKEWNNSLKTKLSLLPKKLFRIRMSRNFGMKMLTMTNLSTECLIQLTKLGYDATPFNQILKQNAKREMRLRLGKVTVADVLAAQPVTT